MRSSCVIAGLGLGFVIYDLVMIGRTRARKLATKHVALANGAADPLLQHTENGGEGTL